MKHKLYIFIFILIGILVLIILQMNVNRELFEIRDNGDYDYRTIDRISYGNGNYSYCIGGRVTCQSNYLTSSPIDITQTNQSYSGGKTYKPYCIANGIETPANKVKCDGTIYENMNMVDMSENILPLSKIPFPISYEYKGFTYPYSYVPAAIDATNKNKVNFFRNSSKTIAETEDICYLYDDTDMDNCKLSLFGSIANYPRVTAEAPDYDPNDLGVTIQSRPSRQSSQTSSGSGSGTGKR